MQERLLAHAALSQMVFAEIHFTAEEQEMVEDSLVDIENTYILDDEKNSFKQVIENFADKLDQFQDNGYGSNILKWYH